MSHRLYTLLTAIVLGIACAYTATSALATSASHTPAPAAAPVATAAAHARAGGRHAKHARATCRAARRHHRKHRRRCREVTRAVHHGRSHHSGDTPAQAGKHSQPAQTPRLHARRADRGSELTTVVTAGTRSGAATIASVLATPCQNTEATPEAGNLEQVQAATLCLVNQERARNNELPLRPSAQLAQAALLHSEDMVKEDYFAHVAPGGETPLDRVRASGYLPNSRAGYTIGENIAWGTLYLATPKSIVAAWIASPEHQANILNGDYRDTAIGVVPSAPPSLAEEQAGAIYTQEFGVIQG